MNVLNEKQTRSKFIQRFTFFIALGLALLTLGMAWSNTSIEMTMRNGQTGVLAWGPTLFRALLILHGLVLMGIAVTQLVFRDYSMKDGAEKSPDNKSSRVVWLLLFALCAIAIPLRLYRLDTDLWIDEVLTLVLFVRPPFGEILTSFPAQNQHMLYSVMAKAVIAFLGESAWTLRLPAVLFGVLSIPALFLLARKLTDKWQALFACALMTLSYHHIWFSQNARGYTGVLFFATLSTWLWINALPQRRRGLWLAYIIIVVLGIWVHLTMVFVAASQGLTYVLLLIFGRPDSSGRKKLGNVALGSWWMPLAAGTLCITLSLQLYALSLPDFLSSGFHEVSLESEWTQLWWLVRETIRGLHIGFGGLLAAVILMAVLAVGWLSICRRNWTVGLSIVVAPLALCALMVVKGHNLWPRFVFFCAGFIILILVHGVNLVTRRFCRTIMPAAGPRAELCCFVTPLVVILVTSAAMIPKNYALPKQNYTAARDYVEQRLGPLETAVAIGLAGTVFESYYAPDWKCAKTAKQLEMALRRYRRIWLVYTMPIHVRAYHPDIWTLIQREFENERVFPGTLAGGEVFVCKTKRSLSALSPYTELSADAYEKPTDKR